MTIKAIRMFDGGFVSQPFAFSQPRQAGAPLYMGDRVSGYVEALKGALPPTRRQTLHFNAPCQVFPEEIE